MILELIINDRTLLWLHMIFKRHSLCAHSCWRTDKRRACCVGTVCRAIVRKANIELIALNETISGKRQLSTEMALQIESVMGIPASLLLNIQIQYNSFLRRK